MNEFEPVDSDIELLRAALSDPDAFGSFYRRHAVAVERWIRAQTPDLATAADLTAETFAQALVARATSQRAAGCTGSPATWYAGTTAADASNSRPAGSSASSSTTTPMSSPKSSPRSTPRSRPPTWPEL